MAVTFCCVQDNVFNSINIFVALGACMIVFIAPKTHLGC